MAVAVIAQLDAQLRLSRALRTLQTEQLRTDSVDSLRQLCGMLVKIASIPGPLRMCGGPPQHCSSLLCAHLNFLASLLSSLGREALGKLAFCDRQRVEAQHTQLQAPLLRLRCRHNRPMCHLDRLTS